MSERITIIEEWCGDTRTRYILNSDGRKELMDIETISPRPFVMWYPAQTLEILRRDFLPGAKYMDEPKISRYLNERN